MSFPGMEGALWNLTEPVQFNIVATAAKDYEAVDTLEAQTPFDGTLEPLTPRQLAIKPEGERRWKWWSMWTEQALRPGNIVQDEAGTQYRVMGTTNWSQGGYQQYEIIETPNPPYSGA